TLTTGWKRRLPSPGGCWPEPHARNPPEVHRGRRMVARYLIVNADDFGLSPGVNRGIIEAHENGIVTSASLMVRWPAAQEAAAYALASPRLGLGLHLDFCEWIVRDHEWVIAYEVVSMTDATAIDQEVARQIET